MDQTPQSTNNQNPNEFKLASTEVQGPKSPLISGSNSKFVLIAIASIVIIVAGIGGYYFYTKNNNSGIPNIPEVVLSPTPMPTVDKNLDTDGDGLPDEIEKVLGTSVNNPDSDGDTFSDLNEIKNGYSPLAAGGVGKYTQEEWDVVKGKIKIENAEFYDREFEAAAVSPSPTVTSN